MIELEYSEVCLLNTFKQKNIADWKLINQAVGNYYIYNYPGIKFNRFPGFVFSNKYKADLYYKYIFSNYIDMETPPRGNLTDKVEYIFIGFKPGTKDHHLSIRESAWLFGQPSAILNNLLEEFSIYPYFTNLSHYRYTENFNLSHICNEINFVINVISRDVKCVFLGKYEEYSEVISYITNTFGNKCIQIWHPSFINRNNNSKELYDKWINRFKFLKED